MAWRDGLRPGSFRGVQFYVDSATLNAGRRLARHEYPQRDIPYMEDMGRKAREYKVEAIVVGDGYMDQRNKLLDAIEMPGAGQLVHPYYGTLFVTVSSDTQLTESTSEGGMAKFSLTFVEAGKQEEPNSSADTLSMLNDQYDLTEASIGSDFANKFSITNQADFVAGDAMASANKLMSMPSMALGNLSWIQANPLSALNSLLPQNLLSSLGNPLQFAKGILSLVRSATDISALFSFNLPADTSMPAATPSQQALVNNRAAINDLVLQAATARRIYDLSTSEPATLDDARTARAEIVTRADTVLFSPTISQGSADAMVQMRTDAVQHFMAQTASLPQLVTITNQVDLPAVVLAHDFYGDEWYDKGMDDDLVARNRVRNPGFVPAGQALQLISE